MESANFGTALAIFAILSLLFIGGLLFLIIYGLIKKKRAMWITGVIVLLVSLFLYAFTYCRAYNAAARITEEAKERVEE